MRPQNVKILGPQGPKILKLWGPGGPKMGGDLFSHDTGNKLLGIEFITAIDLSLINLIMYLHERAQESYVLSCTRTHLHKQIAHGEI